MATQQEVARHLDLGDARYIRQLLERGILPRAKVGLDLDACRVAYIRHLRTVAAGHQSADGALDLTAERARLSKEQADAQELKNAITRGELVSALDVQSLGASFASGVSQRVLGLRVLAPAIRAAETDDAGATILEDGAREALEEIARVGDIVAELARRSRRGAAIVDGGDATAPEADGEPVGGRGAASLT